MKKKKIQKVKDERKMKRNLKTRIEVKKKEHRKYKKS